MATTFYCLAKIQQFARGGTNSALKTSTGTANWAERNLLLGRASHSIGNASNRLAQTGRLGKGVVSAAELGAEVTAFHYLSDA